MELLIRNFETGTLKGLKISGTPPEITRAKVRAGNYGMSAYNHRKNSSTPGRTEVVILKEGGGRLEIPYTGSFWVGFSVYVPEDWLPDREGLRETLFQLHALPYYKDGGPKQPPFALGFRENAWDLISRGGATEQWNFPVDLGSWHDWVLRFRLSASDSGLIQVLHNAKLVAQKKGRNKQPDGKSVYFKFGLYKWSWKEKHGDKYPSNMDDRLYFIDEIRIGASYEEVAPPGSPSSPIAPPDPEPTPPLPPPVPDPDPPEPPSESEGCLGWLSRKLLELSAQIAL